MSQTDNLIGRFKAEFLSQIISTLAGALLVILLARFLDADEYGLLFLSISLLTVLSILSKLGIGQATATYISEYKIRDKGQIPHIIRFSILYSLLPISIVSILLVFGHTLISDLVGEPALEPLLLLGVFYIIFGTLTTYVRIVFQGFEEIQLSATLNAINSLIRLISAVIMVGLGFGAFGGLAGYILGFFAASFIGLILIYLRIYTKFQRSESAEKGISKKIYRYSIPITATSAADVLDREIDSVLVGFLINPTAVSFYIVAKQVLMFIKTPLSALGFTISPSFGAKKAEGDIHQASRIYETALIHSLLLYIPAAVGLFIIAEPVIQLLFGEEYLGAVRVLQVLTIFSIFQAVTQLTSSGLDYLGRARARAIAKGITAFLNFLLNLLLIPIMGVVGAAVATDITFGIYTFINFYIICEEFEIRLDYILRKILVIVVISMIMSIVIYPLAAFISGWLTLLAVVSIGVIIWVILSLSLGMISLSDVSDIL